MPSPLLGLALASTLSFMGPGDGDPSSEAPIIIVTPAPAPAPEPPPPVPDWGPSSSVVISQPAPARPLAPPAPVIRTPRAPMMGVGLFIGAGVAFGVGLAGRLDQVDTATRNCDRWQSSSSGDAPFNSLTGCFDYFDSPGLDANDMFVGAAYGTSMVLTMIASGALGQHKAWQTVHGDGRLRNPNGRYVFGAIFTGLGVASIAAHYALIYTDAQNPCTSWECNVQRRALWIAASDGGALLLNTGLGLFSWAGNYRSNLEKYQRPQWSVMPGAARGSVGATASVRF
jgi:hypothetical protein